jgi:hypothetical protein
MEKTQVSPSRMASSMFMVEISHLTGGYDVTFSDENQAQMVARAIDKIRENDRKQVLATLNSKGIFVEDYLSGLK